MYYMDMYYMLYEVCCQTVMMWSCFADALLLLSSTLTVCLPYRAAQMLPVLHHFMQCPGKEYVDCRCRAVESAGYIVGALGADDPVISPHINGMMEVALQGYSTTDSPDLRDHSHSMFANVATALGENFAVWLPRVVPLAFESCKQEDGQAGDNDSSESIGEEDDTLSDEGSDDEGEGRHFNVRTGTSAQGLGMALCVTLCGMREHLNCSPPP